MAFLLLKDNVFWYRLAKKYLSNLITFILYEKCVNQKYAKTDKSFQSSY